MYSRKKVHFVFSIWRKLKVNFNLLSHWSFSVNTCLNTCSLQQFYIALEELHVFKRTNEPVFDAVLPKKKEKKIVKKEVFPFQCIHVWQVHWLKLMKWRFFFFVLLQPLEKLPQHISTTLLHVKSKRESCLSLFF